MKISESTQAYICAAVAGSVVIGIGFSSLGTGLAQSIIARLPNSLSSALNSKLVGRATVLVAAGGISFATYAVSASHGVLLSHKTKQELMQDHELQCYYVELTPGERAWESPKNWTLDQPLPRDSYDKLNALFGNTLPELK